ncbi:hypothetical protein AAFF_G00216550, partial [Aldrovandia affinis]
DENYHGIVQYACRWWTLCCSFTTWPFVLLELRQLQPPSALSEGCSGHLRALLQRLPVHNPALLTASSRAAQAPVAGLKV